MPRELKKVAIAEIRQRSEEARTVASDLAAVADMMQKAGRDFYWVDAGDSAKEGISFLQKLHKRLKTRHEEADLGIEPRGIKNGRRIKKSVSGTK